MPAAPYPLGGEARDVVEDVRRLGGFGIAAHPGFAEAGAALARLDAPFDGDRVAEPRHELARVGAAGQRRSAARGRRGGGCSRRCSTIRSGRPKSIAQPAPAEPASSTQWAALARAPARRRASPAPTRTRSSRCAAPIPATAGCSLPLPGYESSFRALSVHVRPDRAADRRRRGRRARVLMRAIRAGHLYTAVDGVATPPSFEFTATNAHGTAQRGRRARRRRTGDAARAQQRAGRVHDDGLERRDACSSGDHHEQDFTVAAPAGPARVLGRDPRAGRSPPDSPGSAATRSTCASAGRRGAGADRSRRRRRARRSSTARTATAGASSTIRRRWRRVDVAPIGRRRRAAVPLRAGRRRVGRAGRRARGRHAARRRARTIG